MNLTNCRCWVEETNKCVCSVTTLRSVEQFTFPSCPSLNIVPCVVSGPGDLLRCKTSLVVSFQYNLDIYGRRHRFYRDENKIISGPQAHEKTSLNNLAISQMELLGYLNHDTFQNGWWLVFLTLNIWTICFDYLHNDWLNVGSFLINIIQR